MMLIDGFYKIGLCKETWTWICLKNLTFLKDWYTVYQWTLVSETAAKYVIYSTDLSEREKGAI